MRLQLSALALGVATVAGLAPAAAADEEPRPGQVNVASKLALYQDDDATRVITSTVNVTSDVSRKVSVQAYGQLDSISTASVDVVSTASRRFDETRYEAGARVTVRLPVELSARYSESVEPDWHARTGTLTLGRDLFAKNTHAELALAYGANQISRVGGPTLHNFLARYQGAASLTQLWDERTLLGASYTLEYDDGCQANQYRTVTTGDRHVSPELHPHTRVRQALGARVLRHLFEDSSVAVDFRLYFDDWGIVSDTAGVTYAVRFGDTDLRVRARGYLQSEADFWRRSYPVLATYMSANRELSPFFDVSAGAQLSRRFGRFTADLAADGTLYHFVDYALLTQQTAVVVTAGFAADL